MRQNRGIRARQTHNTLRIGSNANTPTMWYVFVADAPIQAADSTEMNDVVLRDDGKYVARGQVGTAGFDEWRVEADSLESFGAFEFTGYVDGGRGNPTETPVPESNYVLEWNGSPTTISELTSGGGGGNGGNGNGGDPVPDTPPLPEWVNWRNAALLGVGYVVYTRAVRPRRNASPS